jgi:2-hydroxychromene-2-carboxylate isomerase
MSRRVDFYFGPGSRYSYLAATQLGRLAEDTGAVFRWRAVLSADLIAASGDNPFAPDRIRGAYDPDYRSADVTRWARHYGVPFVDIDPDGVDWRALAVACVAADRLAAGETFARKLLERCHAEGRPPMGDDGLYAFAVEAGLPSDAFARALRAQETANAYADNLSAAIAEGAFGVPSFVADDGELFFGQDRLVLLRDHLLG